MQPRSNIEWQKWAQDDPLYGIATRSGRERDGSNPWTLEEFYAYGATNWAEYYPQWQQYGVGRESCLEIGCGAGRVTRQLVQCFQSVYGVDVSSEMIALARANVPSANFVLVDGTSIPLDDD
jgi:SAM-dependent methyltransferase